MMHRFRSIAMIALLISSARAAAAQQVSPEKWGGLEVFTGALDTESAETQGTADRMWGGQLNFGIVVFHVVSVSADAGVVGLRDHRSFTESTTLGDKTSAVGGVLGSMLAGLRAPPLRLAPKHAADITATVNVGYTWVGISRSIDHCIDCTVESVRVHAGEFWEPGLQFFHGRRGISARYRIYSTGADLQNALMIGYALRAGRDLPPPQPQRATVPDPGVPD